MNEAFNKNTSNPTIVLEQLPLAGMVLAGPDFVIQSINTAAMRLLDRPETIRGKRLTEAFPELERQEFMSALKAISSPGAALQEANVFSYVHRQSQRAYLNFSIKATTSVTPEVTIVVLASGVSGPHQTMAETAKDLVIDSAGLGVYNYDYRTGALTSSQRMANIFGFDAPASRDEYATRIHPDDKEINLRAQQTLAESGQVSFEIRLLMSDRSCKWVRIRNTLLFDEGNTPVQAVGSAEDITAERIAFDRLRESESRFRTLITEAPEVGTALYTGPEIRIQYVNDVMLRFWGKDETVIGKTFLEALPETRDQPFFGQLKHVFSTGETIAAKEQKVVLEVEGRLVAAYYNYTYKALKDVNGAIYGIHHMAVDVSDQVKAKMQLKKREEGVRRLFMQTPVGIGVFTGDSLTIELVNDSMLRYWGRKHEEAINKPLWEVLPEVRAQGIDKILEDVLKTGKPYAASETPVNFIRDGRSETVYVNFALQALTDADGNITGLIAIGADVTDLVKTRNQAELNQARLQNLADSMPQLVWIAEEDGRVTYYNKQVGNFAGARQRPDGTWEWENILHPDDLQPTHEAWDHAVKTKSMYQVEHRVKMTDGTFRWHLSRAFVYRNEQGLRWYGTATDVHDQKLMEMTLESLVRERTVELQRSNDDLQQFAHVASHDLKEPLRKIKTFSYKLQEEFKEALQERGNRFIEKIISSSDRMYEMINGVLKYASVASPSAGYQSVDLNEVVRNVQTDLELLIQEKQATIESADLPTVIGAPDLIHQLFYNLVNNSLKFSQKDVPARVQITARSVSAGERSFAEITITDNGIGFENEFSDMIFGTFIRLHSKDKFEGTGLGLALCKRIVERHGGTITASSRQGVGSVFTLTLPS